MRTGVKVLVAFAILGVLAAGLLPPVLDSGALRDYANSAAQAGFAAQLGQGSSTASVNRAVTTSVASHHGVQIKSVRVNGGVVTVVLTERVHSFMEHFPGLKGWFQITATQQASTPTE